GAPVPAAAAGQRPTRGQARGGEQPARTQTVTVEKVGRNEPCPCGSGKKYKFCCGR
ncbi:MAG TPA: hypothetical protein DCZ72_03595, partial [Armatimonadetes bacterium]|nr:hypothetical protein [Armatimonadota bacterium]